MSQFPAHLTPSVRSLIERYVSMPPAGFVIQSLSCGHCIEKDRLDLFKTYNYDKVEGWLRKHQGCEARANIEKLEIRVPVV